MSQEEHNEWPSFEAVLRDVATYDVSPHDDAAIDSDGSVEPVDRFDAAPVVSYDPPEIISTDRETFVDTPGDILVDPALLPEPLPPLEIDTSSIRALLEPRTPLTREEFDLEALAPLAPSAFDAEFEASVDLEPSVDPDTDPPSVFDLAFDEGSGADIFEELGLKSEISFDDVPANDDLPVDSPFDLNDSSDAIESERIEAFGPDLYEQPASLEDNTEFDSVATAAAIEGELSELSDLTDIDSELETNSEDSPFADVMHFDNVVPIRPETDDGHEAAPEQAVDASPSVEAPLAARVSHTGLVGLENSEVSQPEQEQDEEDPWAYMRPNDVPRSGGIWAKIFGGEQRKAAKAKRQAEAKRQAKANTETAGSPEATEDVPDVSFDSTCPNCGGGCQVDLDDPIGKRVHVSCPSCDHMWFTPYIIDAQAG